MRAWKHTVVILLIPALAIGGYFVMKLMLHIVPMGGDNLWRDGLVTLAVTLLGIAVPYWMLKAGFFEAHKFDSNEKELHLSDLPKDKQQLSDSR